MREESGRIDFELRGLFMRASGRTPSRARTTGTSSSKGSSYVARVNLRSRAWLDPSIMGDLLAEASLCQIFLDLAGTRVSQ